LATGNLIVSHKKITIHLTENLQFYYSELVIPRTFPLHMLPTYLSLFCHLVLN
jgi:hypothetical protein